MLLIIKAYSAKYGSMKWLINSAIPLLKIINVIKSMLYGRMSLKTGQTERYERMYVCHHTYILSFLKSTYFHSEK